MRSDVLFPYLSGLERVIPVSESCTANNFKLTLVSVETYPRQGFLLTFNAETMAPNTAFNRLGRVWMEVAITDERGNPYTGFEAMIPGAVHNYIFRGRAVVVCMPHIREGHAKLRIVVDMIEWEYTDGGEGSSSLEQIKGPWTFEVAY